MKAEILSIGTELLLGATLNTNAQHLSRRLAEVSIDVFRQVTVGDNPSRLSQALSDAADRADLVITTGGLGPTEDDVTMAAFAAFAGVRLREDRRTREHITSQLDKRGKTLTPLIRRQCLVPTGGRIYQNPVGTAPAVLSRFRRGGRTVLFLLLPGPPREMKPLLEEVLPVLSRQVPVRQRSVFMTRSVRITGPTEAEVASCVPDLLKLPPPLTVGIYAKPGEVELRIMCKAPDRSSALGSLQKMERTIRGRLGPVVYGVDQERMSDVVGALLREKRLTIAVAESCTGGLISKQLTDTPGSSAYFMGGLVSYDDRIKRRVLGVPARTLRTHGAVSRRTARSMAERALRLFGTDLSVAITGVAGPSGGSALKPVGTVWIALADGGSTECNAYRFTGDRGDVRERAAHKALDLVRLRLIGSSTGKARR